MNAAAITEGRQHVAIVKGGRDSKKDQVEVGKSRVMLKRPEMLAIVGLGYTTVWRMERRGEFPARKRLSPQRVAWVRSEVEAWLAGRENVVQGNA